MEQRKKLPGLEHISLEGGAAAQTGDNTYAVSGRDRGAYRLVFGPSRAVAVHREGEELYTLCPTPRTPAVECNGDVWVLPEAGGEGLRGVRLRGERTKKLILSGGELVVEHTGSSTLEAVADRPLCDVLGNRIRLDFPGSGAMGKALAHFYWDTLVPSVIERTDALAYPEHEGYVVSTLDDSKYAGTYPDVDHEFQCKGRLALNGGLERSVVRRMMDLQLRMMREDPTGLWRNPCAVQPDGTREYHVRRDSLDHTENAEMFLVTGNVEILETAWLYYARTRDKNWLGERMEALEGAASLLEHLTDSQGRLWSDVFYEDQVIKDGMECMSAALAANSLGLLAELEEELGRAEQADRFARLGRSMAEALVRPCPQGFWDPENRRFVDWIDRHGGVHDHVHLLANCLPVLFRFGSGEQRKAAAQVIADHFGAFQRFPSFVSPYIEAYTDSEMGTAGPYDLCAAGRYWCWDAACWGSLGRRDVLHRQLVQVAAQGELDGYRMGERYDMNHVYYINELNWHGSAYYYEYPCVFAWVLVQEYLGIRPGVKVDYVVRPMLAGYGSAGLESCGIAYRYQADRFTLENTGAVPLSLRLELEALYPGEALYYKGEAFREGGLAALTPGEKAVFERGPGERAAKETEARP